MILDIFDIPTILSPRYVRSGPSLIELAQFVRETIYRSALPRVLLHNDKIPQSAPIAYNASTAVYAATLPDQISIFKPDHEGVVRFPVYNYNLDHLMIEEFYFPALVAYSTARHFVLKENKTFLMLLDKAVSVGVETTIEVLPTIYSSAAARISSIHKPQIIKVLCCEKYYRILQSTIDLSYTKVVLIPEKDLPDRIYILPPSFGLGVLYERTGVSIGPSYHVTGQSPNDHFAFEDIGMSILYPQNADVIRII